MGTNEIVFVMPEKQASCSCGQLSVKVKGEPVRVSICHCLACQKRTGSVFGAQARFEEANVVIQGKASTYVRRADSGNDVTLSFCPECGSTVYYRLSALPSMVAVPLGAFADSEYVTPSVSVYEARKHPWVSVPESWEHWDLLG